MESLKSSWRICLAALIGFMVGLLMFRTATVKAQQYAPGFVTVERVSSLGSRGTVQHTGQVVGFSCVQTDGGTQCYVASVPK
jgi:hypothetical protein